MEQKPAPVIEVNDLRKSFEKITAVNGITFSVQAGAVVRFLEEQGIEVSEARRIQPTPEEVFVRIAVNLWNIRKI